MDPNLFHIDWERTLEALALVVLLAFVIERALALLFENRLFIERFDRSGVKEVIALAVSIAVCVAWKFDLVSIVILTERTTIPGYVLTGALIAGGSKASLKFFHDVLQVKSASFEARHELQAQQAARVAEAAAKDAELQQPTGRSLVGAARQARKAASRAADIAAVNPNRSTKESAERALRATERIEYLSDDQATVVSPTPPTPDS